jgi:hypothetical protein
LDAQQGGLTASSDIGAAKASLAFSCGPGTAGSSQHVFSRISFKPHPSPGEAIVIEV